MITPIGINIGSPTRHRSGIAMSAGEIAIRAGNTVAWYDSTDLTTITKDTGATESVSRWNDKLGSGHDLIQATVGRRPIWSATGILFSGTTPNGPFMKTAAFTYNQPEYIYMVARQITWDGAAGDMFIDGNTDLSGIIQQDSTTPRIRLYAGSATGGNANMTLNTFCIVRAFFNGAASKLQINATTAVTGNVGTRNMGGISLAGKSDGGNECHIEVREAVFRNAADDVTTETAIYDYLKAKYSL